MADRGALVPDNLAGDVLRRLIVSLTADGQPPRAATQRLLQALYDASKRHERGIVPASVDEAPELPAEPAAPERTVAEAALQLGCSERWVRQQLADGKLEGRKRGGVWLIAG